MLPGFDNTKKHRVHNCLALQNLFLDIQNSCLQSIETYKSNECIKECFIEINMMYYQAFMVNEEILHKKKRTNHKNDHTKGIDLSERTYQKNDNTHVKDVNTNSNLEKLLESNKTTVDTIGECLDKSKDYKNEINKHVSISSPQTFEKRNEKTQNHKELYMIVSDFASDENACLRRLSVLKSNNKIHIKNMLNDPIYTVRYAAISKTQPCVSLVKFLTDKEWTIRLKAIQKLSDKQYIKKLSQSDLNLIFTNICERINDINVNVRIEVAKVLQNFKQINKFKVKELISKKDINDNVAPGTFVHGFEDENEDVRANMIESISILTCDNEMANEAFDFLSDLLNDDIYKVKETASFWMLKLSQSYKVKVKDEIIDLLFCNFLESNENLKKHLFEAFNFLEFSEEFVEYVFFKWLNLLIKKNETNKILKCIKSLVKKNIGFFYLNYQKYANDIFNKKNNELKKLQFMIINELKEDGFEIELDANDFENFDEEGSDVKSEITLECSETYIVYFNLPIKYNIKCKTELQTKNLSIKIVNNHEILCFPFLSAFDVFLYEKCSFFDVFVISNETEATLIRKRVNVIYK